MPDPFEQLRTTVAPLAPDPAFAARLRARIERALSSPEGATVTTMTVPSAPALTPYLAVRDARAAIAWYREVFSAVPRSDPVVMPDGRIGHAELAIGGSLLMLADEHAEIGHVAPRGGGSSVTLHLSVADVDAAARTAVAHGAELVRPPTTAEYGRGATVVDPFGHRWLLMTEVIATEPLRAGDVAYASLQVRDVRRAGAFFSSVLGWELSPDGSVAGSAPHHAIRGADGAPTLFLCITVDDVAAAVARVQAAGGQATIPEERPYGIVADCTDDQGTPFAVWQRGSAPGRRAGSGGWRQGDLTYVTLEVVDSARFRRFFSAVTGWQFAAGRVEDGWEVRDVAPMIGSHGGHDAATAVPMYVVDDIAAAVARVRVAGGSSTDPERQPYGVSATCTDDQGTRFYLVQY
ncbi:MAG TPA: VOC family protein [Acidimicrobiales bacterium]|nr:VOC family protein [Acidimicrobiales bacterium]